MKTCPFCGQKPSVNEVTAICRECNISIPLARWEGQADVCHEIGGAEWYTDGHKIAICEDRLPYVLLKSDLERIMNGEWVEASPDGYFRTIGGAYAHRYRTADAVMYIDAGYEEGYEVRELETHARRMGDGHVVRYSSMQGPILYVMSLRPDVQEVK